MYLRTMVKSYTPLPPRIKMETILQNGCYQVQSGHAQYEITTPVYKKDVDTIG